MGFYSSRLIVDSTSRNVCTDMFGSSAGPTTIKNIGDTTVQVGYAGVGSSHATISEPGFPLLPGETCVLSAGALDGTGSTVAAFNTDSGTSTLAYYATGA